MSDAYNAKLREWPQIKGDSKGLQEFFDFLGNCEETMKTMKFMDNLNSDETLAMSQYQVAILLWCEVVPPCLYYQDANRATSQFP